jgi:hypothetical protein
MYKIQTNFFAGDATFISDFTEVATFEEAMEYVLNNKPPSEFEWNVRQDGMGSATIWTSYSGQKVNAWVDGKIVEVRSKSS